MVVSCAWWRGCGARGREDNPLDPDPGHIVEAADVERRELLERRRREVEREGIATHAAVRGRDGHRVAVVCRGASASREAVQVPTRLTGCLNLLAAEGVVVGVDTIVTATIWIRTMPAKTNAAYTHG